jgi:hypothetical protein
MANTTPLPRHLTCPSIVFPFVLYHGPLPHQSATECGKGAVHDYLWVHQWGAHGRSPDARVYHLHILPNTSSNALCRKCVLSIEPSSTMTSLPINPTALCPRCWLWCPMPQVPTSLINTRGLALRSACRRTHCVPAVVLLLAVPLQKWGLETYIHMSSV